MRRRLLTALALTATLSLFASSALAQTPSGDGDDRVTGHPYLRHDGGTDQAIQECSSLATNPAPDNIAGDGDIDSNDGGNRHQNNEPFSVIDPTNPNMVVAGWNDYCSTDLGAGWMGLGFSADRGETWVNSLVPGYPQDTSAEGMASPLYGSHTDAGDPVAAFDRAGNLYAGGIAFNRVRPANGDVWVAKYLTTPHPSGYPYDYAHTRIVGQGTPSAVQGGIFQDKIMLEVDRTGGAHDGNVYVCWTRFVAAGQNRIYFSRSTDGGNSFSRPIAISGGGNIRTQGCDIAIEHDGDVYVAYRTFATPSMRTATLAYARSTDGGASFGPAQIIRSIVPYNPFDTDRNCGDGPVHCPSDFVFARIPLEVRIAADQTGGLPGVYLAYMEIRPDSIVASTSSYSSAGPGLVGQSLVYLIRSTNNGATWSAPTPVDPQPVGHQFFPDLDLLDGTLAVMWQDSRTDPAYSVQRPIGNTRDAQGRAVSSGRNIVNTFLTSSTTGTSFTPALRISSQGNQPEYEMFSNRDLPFYGDYNWLNLARLAGGGLLGYTAWTDNRDVVAGADPRESFNDGFDVLQCRTQQADGSFGPDTCANAGGLNQNIYGISFTLP
jgi:hypothetical protein